MSVRAPRLLAPCVAVALAAAVAFAPGVFAKDDPAALKAAQDAIKKDFATQKKHLTVDMTYYVDSTTTPGTPRLTRVVNNFPAQALAGVVEDLDLTYDLYDGTTNPTGVTSLPACWPIARTPSWSAASAPRPTTSPPPAITTAICICGAPWVAPS